MIITTEIHAWIEQAVNEGAVVLDIRSEGEHAAGHIPGALSFPLLNNEERHIVGITYKEKGQHEAVHKGFELVGHKFSSYIRKAEELSPSREVMLYCWRGGMRSNIMAWLLNLSGFRVTLLEGGYKAYRQYCYEKFSENKRLLQLTGATGTGKTEVLHALQSCGEQVIDLEQIACHKGSAFGGLGQPEAPSQEHFENLIGWQLGMLKQPSIWVEGESRFIGKLRIPDTLYNRMETAERIEVERSAEERIERIISEYGHFPVDILLEKTQSLRKRMGGENVKESTDALHVGDMEGWLRPLLVYYDKTYTHSSKSCTGVLLLKLDITGKKADEAARILIDHLRTNKK